MRAKVVNKSQHEDTKLAMAGVGREVKKAVSWKG